MKCGSPVATAYGNAGDKVQSCITPHLPFTGLDLSFVLIVGVVLILLALSLRRVTRSI